jgi:hypothetical protein
MSSRKTAPRPLTRLSTPVTLPGATEYSDDPALNDPLTMISRVKGLGYRWKRLRDDVRIDHNWGPRRSPGDWALVMLEFTVSKMVDIEPWYHDRYENTTFWKACGFRNRPSKSLVYERLKELEAFAGEFDRLAAGLIRIAGVRCPAVGQSSPGWQSCRGTACVSASVTGTPRHCRCTTPAPRGGNPAHRYHRRH